MKVTDETDISWSEIHKVEWKGEDGYPAFDFENWDGEANGLSEAPHTPEFQMEVIGNIYENPELVEKQ